jgi:NADH:ubiquinone reductase (H+-translocating)
MPTDVVILGAGFAGVSAAEELERIGRRHELNVTLVSRNNYLLFTPMLPEVAGGTIDARDITQPLRAELRRTKFELGEALEADLTDRTVTVESPLTRARKTLRFDQLVLALGSITSAFGIPGVVEHTLPLKTIADAVTLRNRVLGALEVAAATRDLIARDRLLRFIIVGGGFTGVEAAGELLGLVESVRRFYPPIEGSEVSVELVESGSRLLEHLPAKFGRQAAAALRNRGVVLHLGRKIAAVDEDGLRIEDGTRMESGTIVWSAGVEAVPLMRALGARLSKDGAVIVNPDFSVPECRGVWAVGDCAAIPKPEGGTYAPLAQNAVREGPLLARNIISRLAGGTTKDFRYRELGQMASLGGHYGLAELPRGRMLSGLPAWMLWRAYYLGRLPGFYRKSRMALDWTLDALFPQGTTRLPLVSEARNAEVAHATTR